MEAGIRRTDVKDLLLSSATRKPSPAGLSPVETSPAEDRRRGRSRAGGATDHIKRVPQPKSLRERLRHQAALVAERLEQSAPPKKADLDLLARGLLSDLNLPEAFVGWTMVMLASAFWRRRIVSVPHSRRLLLLPGNLSHGPHCRTGLVNGSAASRKPLEGPVPDCAACGVAGLRALAEELGYRVLWAEQSVAALAVLAGAEIDALMGVASLDLLEKAIDQIPQFDIPCMAIPLLEANVAGNGRAIHGIENRTENGSGNGSGNCIEPKAVVPAEPSPPFDADWVRQMIELAYEPAADSTPNYRHLMRAARRMFEPDELERLAPRMRAGPRLAELNGHGIASRGAALLDPVAGTEAIAYDFLTRGGKHSRPFITLAVYDAMTGGRCTLADGHLRVAELPMAVKRAAVSIETFHKASLVHDDIEDDDHFRYGVATLHRALGVPTAINVGDYLIGLGYRLVSRESGVLGPEVVSDIMDRLADAHMKLAEGQGAELLWRDSRRKRLSPAEALEIYALKTAPAFEAALITGLRLAGPSDPYRQPIGEFAQHLGIAFQILNDLADWLPDNHNKLVAAGDVLGGRPTLLWALALEGLSEPSRTRLEMSAASAPVTEATIDEIRALYQEASVFDKAERFVAEYDKRARIVAESLEPRPLCRLLHYLIDVVLKTRS
jgi:geranylgeranyl pyrophosphate synthase